MCIDKLGALVMLSILADRMYEYEIQRLSCFNRLKLPGSIYIQCNG